MKSNKSTKRRSARSKLPKYILENIKHPLMRQAWLVELAAASQQLARSFSH